MYITDIITDIDIISVSQSLCLLPPGVILQT